jgi:hypothetical protein
MCGCSRSTIQLALEKLVELGEIADTGERRKRGTIAWEIVLDGPDLTDSESGHDDMTDSRSGSEGREGDLTDSRDDLTDSRPRPDRRVGNEPEVEPEEEEPEDRTGSAPSATDFSISPSLPNRNSNGNNNGLALADDQAPEQQHVGEGDERPTAIARAEQADREQLLADLEAALERKPKDEVTLRAIETVKGELADAGDLANAADVELLGAST